MRIMITITDEEARALEDLAIAQTNLKLPGMIPPITKVAVACMQLGLQSIGKGAQVPATMKKAKGKKPK